MEAVLNLDIHCEKMRRKAMVVACSLSGVNSVDMKDSKLTVKGEMDAYMVVKKLKKICHTEIVTVGPVKEPEKKPKEPEKKNPEPKEPEVVHYYHPYHPYYNGYYYENPQ
ncbi:unnamed protein product [Cochlearia groenlandica]